MEILLNVYIEARLETLSCTRKIFRAHLKFHVQNENLGAHVFVQEVLGACKTNKNKVIFEWISSVVEHHDLGVKQLVPRCAFFFQRRALPCAFCKLSSLV